MNTFGYLFRVTTWGESHGKAIGAVIDGCPAGLTINEKEITEFLLKNDRPIEELATLRVETNQVQLLSGINNNKTLGTPLSIIINNKDFRSADYNNIKQSFRPGHGDYTYFCKYNTQPVSGGGRASGRECISPLFDLI